MPLHTYTHADIMDEAHMLFHNRTTSAESDKPLRADVRCAGGVCSLLHVHLDMCCCGDPGGPHLEALQSRCWVFEDCLETRMSNNAAICD